MPKQRPRKTDPGRHDSHDRLHSGGARLGLFILLTGTVLFAGGALFVKFQLETFRAGIQDGLEERIGARLAMGTVSVNGFRGVRIEDLHMKFAADNGPELELTAPLAFVHINLNDLVYGRVSVDRIVLDNSTIVVRRPPEADWYDPRQERIEQSFNLRSADSFRVMGRNCTLRVENLIGDSNAQVGGFSFDVSRLDDAENLAATFEGYLSNDSEKRLQVKLSAASGEDFDFRIQTSKLTAEDVNLVFPASEDFVESGETRATIWINGRPDHTVVISLHALFDNLRLREQPEFVEPASGTLSMLAYYSNDTDILTIANASADSEAIGGDLGGTIRFAERYPVLNLRLSASKLPSQDVLNYVFENTDETYGTFDVSLAENQDVYLKIEGSTESPKMLAVLNADRGSLEFVPTNPDFPEVALELSGLQAQWDPSREDPLTLTCAIADGKIRHADTETEIGQVYGAIRLDEGVLRADPIRGVLNDSTLVGTAEYNLHTNDADLSFSGTLPGIGDTVLADLIKHTTLAGDVSVRGTLFKRGDKLTADAHIDATKTEIAYQWWITKPAGIGATAHVTGEMEIGRGAVLNVDGAVGGSEVIGELLLAHDADAAKQWRLLEVHATSDHLDVNSVSNLLHLPYTFTGGTGTDGYFDWYRLDDGTFEQSMGAVVDELTAIPEGAPDGVRIHATSADVRVRMQSESGSKASALITAATARIPKLGTPWLIPLEPPPEYPKKERYWTFDLAVDDIATPPWSGTNFRGSAYIQPDRTGFTNYSADIGEGYIEGRYNVVRETNAGEVHVRWQNIPAATMLEHLNYSNVLAGSMTGNIDYTVDHDDPSTMQGEGRFDIRDGEFSAEFLYALIRGQTEDEFVSLPVSLAFKRVQTDVVLNGDQVATPSLVLNADAFRMTATGHYFRDGDMDYMMTFSLDPQSAARIPVIAQYFNTSGMRIAQQDLVLTFHVTGPTFKPTGRVAGLPPASVTLVSGALEVATEAVKVIDLPRRILIDLVKTGGGIVGP